MEHSSQEIFELLRIQQDKTKGPAQIQKLVTLLFSDPHILVQKIQYLSQKTAKERPNSTETQNKQFDIEAIKEIYKNIELSGESNTLSKCLTQTISKLEDPIKLDQFIKSKTDMKFFFIVILWQQVFTKPQNRQTLFLTLQAIYRAEKYRTLMINWCTQIGQQYLTEISTRLQQQLQNKCQQLQSDPVQILKNLQPWYCIRSICNFIGILHESNKEVKRVPKEVFIFPTLSKYFEPINQFKRQYNKINDWNIIPYAFLMNLDYKHQLLSIQSMVEQKINMQKSLNGGLSGMINAMAQNGNFSLQALIYLHIKVNRNDILNDSMDKLSKQHLNLKSPLRISFVGEQGTDEGGVKNQYFTLLKKQIFNPYRDMFLPKNNGKVYWFNRFSFEAPILFQFVGMLLGLAIYNSVHLDVPFPMVLYKKLLNKNQEQEFNLQLIDDLADLEPDIYQGLKKILKETGDLQDLQLYFNIQIESQFGQKIVQDLVQDGGLIKVNQDNKLQYCQLYADYLINKNISKQFRSFKKGFYRVCSGKMIELLDAIDLKTIIYGNDVLDFEELQKTTDYQGGYTSETPVIKNLWDILHSLNLQEKKAFLVFTTGSDRVPIEGMKALKFVIQKHADSTHLPTAHTCFNVFLLPQYESKQKLEKMIRLILTHNQGFGLI